MVECEVVVGLMSYVRSVTVVTRGTSKKTTVFGFAILQGSHLGHDEGQLGLGMWVSLRASFIEKHGPRLMVQLSHVAIDNRHLLKA